MRDEKRKIESIIAGAMTKAGLTKNEAKVARVYYGSKSAGQRTRSWVNRLSLRKYYPLLKKAQEKAEPFLLGQKGQNTI